MLQKPKSERNFHPFGLYHRRAEKSTGVLFLNEAFYCIALIPANGYNILQLNKGFPSGVIFPQEKGCTEIKNIKTKGWLFNMKVLMINGSPRANGNTYTALHEMEKVFEKEGIETEILNIGTKEIRGCVSCNACKKSGKCAFDDIVNETAAKFEECDGLVVGSPVYYAAANGTLVAFLDRLFYSTGFDKTMKVGASVAAARRGGLSSTFDQLNKYFTISGMPLASGQYWNGIHGRKPGEAAQDEEGMQMMRTLAANMAFLMKSIALGKEKYGIPEKEEYCWTNFVR